MNRETVAKAVLAVLRSAKKRWSTGGVAKAKKPGRNRGVAPTDDSVVCLSDV
jgi:hypothetical protein